MLAAREWAAARPRAKTRHAASSTVATAVPLLQRASCACGGECARCAQAPRAASAPAVSEPGDPLEREADRVADEVLRTPDSALETDGAAEEGAARQSGAAASAPASLGSPAVDTVLRSPGAPLDADTRAFMEPRFGRDFGDVRVHTGEDAARSARAHAARAYTVGRHIVFGAHESPRASGPGRRLLAHELAHVVQQAEGAPMHVARTANAAQFNCPANVNGAPADPFAEIDSADGHAQGLANATAILATVSTVLDPSTGTGALDQAYQTRFGIPARQGARFRNRFTGALHATQAEAAREEMSVIADRLDRIAQFLGGPIRYTCRPLNVAFRYSNCINTCRPGNVAYSCVPQDQRRIELCPDFWTGITTDQRAIAIIHEAGHMLFNMGGHGHGSLAARGRNPECYASLVADTFNIAPFDLRCPPI